MLTQSQLSSIDSAMEFAETATLNPNVMASVATDYERLIDDLKDEHLLNYFDELLDRMNLTQEQRTPLKSRVALKIRELTT
jgi:hypothetical protein